MARSRTSARRIVLQERDKRLLADLLAQRVISRDQMLLLGYFSSVPRLNARLGQLIRAGLVQRLFAETRGNNSPSLYGVGPKGAEIAAEQLGTSVSEAVTQSRRATAPLFLAHTLGLVDLRIAFSVAARELGLEDFEWLAEYRCRHEYSIRLRGGPWQTRVFKPDAFTWWRSGRERVCCFIELDMGSASLEAFERKVRSYQEYLSEGLFAEVYGQNSFHVLTITTGRRRAQSLQHATSQSSRYGFACLQDVLQQGPFQADWLGYSPLGGQS